jgi:hypothetical protein
VDAGSVSATNTIISTDNVGTDATLLPTILSSMISFPHSVSNINWPSFESPSVDWRLYSHPSDATFPVDAIHFDIWSNLLTCTVSMHTFIGLKSRVSGHALRKSGMQHAQWRRTQAEA